MVHSYLTTFTSVIQKENQIDILHFRYVHMYNAVSTMVVVVLNLFIFPFTFNSCTQYAHPQGRNAYIAQFILDSVSQGDSFILLAEVSLLLFTRRSMLSFSLSLV